MLHLQDPRGTVKKEMCGRCILWNFTCVIINRNPRLHFKSLLMLLSVSWGKKFQLFLFQQEKIIFEQVQHVVFCI